MFASLSSFVLMLIFQEQVKKILHGSNTKRKSLVWPITITLVTIFMLYRLWNLGLFSELLGIGPKSVFKASAPAAPLETTDDGFPVDEL
jgi:hypothetical protein